MGTLIATLVLVQALSAIIGAFSAVWGELAYLHAMRDGQVSVAERAHLGALGHGLYFGMTLLLLSSLGLVVLAYVVQAPLQPALTGSYWSFIALALLTTLLTWMLSREHISFSLGSAAIFTAWWYLAYLALGRLPLLTLGASIALYVVATVLFYGLLRLIRHFMTPSERAAADIV